jgi:hypothetical protein
MNIEHASPKSNVKNFLGLGSFYQKFIENFAAHHIRILTMEKAKIAWSETCQKEFEDIKKELGTDNIMTNLDHT